MNLSPPESEPGRPASASLPVIARAWTRIGVTGFGGPPAHITLLRELMVTRTRWMDAQEFEDANAACGLLPGPASTQLAIFCAYRVGGSLGAVVGGLGFVAPAVVLILALSVPFLGSAPPLWIRGAGAGAGAVVAAVAAQAARSLIGPSLARVRQDRARTGRWIGYVVAGTVAAVLAGPYLVLVLLGCGLSEGLSEGRASGRGADARRLGAMAPTAIHVGGLGAVAWTALKVGALSFGGGFVIVPLMQNDAVHTYHWMSDPQFLNAVALGQITPGPVVATVAAVGYAAHGWLGGLLAATVAFLPSFSFVLLGGGRFERIRGNRGARAFLNGAGPAAIGAILGASVDLAGAIHETWEFTLLGVSAVALLILRRGVVSMLLTAGVIGVIAVYAGAPLGA